MDITEKKTFSFGRSFGAYAWADKTFTINKDDFRFANVIDYLSYNMGGVVVNEDSVMVGFKKMGFMVDGMEFDLKEFKTIHMRDIETIDTYVDPWSSKHILIAIYRKPYQAAQRYDDPEIHGRIIPKLKGFGTPAIFYSPKYTLENIHSTHPDFRPTLYWNPDVSFLDGQATLNFFTSDELADYVIYLEGITKNGKICYGTTSFKVDK